MIASIIIHIWVLLTFQSQHSWPSSQSSLHKWHLSFHSFFCWLVNTSNQIKLQLDATNFYLVLSWLKWILYYYIHFQFSSIELIDLPWALEEKNIASAECLVWQICWTSLLYWITKILYQTTKQQQQKHVIGLYWSRENVVSKSLPYNSCLHLPTLMARKLLFISTLSFSPVV